MRVQSVLVSVFILLLVIVSSSGGQTCGDINNDTKIDISDLTYCIDYFIGGPAPVNPSDADINNCNGIDWADVDYFLHSFFRGGPDPCALFPDCSAPVGGSITLDHVDGAINGNELLINQPIVFYLRITNNTSDNYTTYANGFEISSPDGAVWNNIVIDTTSLLGRTHFNLDNINYDYPISGSVADTVFSAGISISTPGIAAGTDGIGLTITIGPFGAGDVGKTVTLDSSFFAPGTKWQWSKNGSTFVTPAWGGPYTFTIVQPPTTMITLDNVTNSPAPGEIYSDRIVSFNLRLTNNEPYEIMGLTNGFEVYSEDGAQWGSTQGDTIGSIGMSMFDLIFNIDHYSADGMLADTVGFGGARLYGSGMGSGFDEVSYAIRIGPIDPVYNGSAICLDSCWFPPSGQWLWATNTGQHMPAWDGPHCFTIVEAPDTLINLVQWPESQGGNDHWYGIIPIVQNWLDHQVLAESYEYDGNSGYLATISSAEENQFIYDNLLVGNTGQPSVNDQFFIGGFYSGGWGWTTGEPMGYTHWASGEPSGDGQAIAIWGASNGSKSGFWNDFPHNGSPTSIYRIWSLVEFGPTTVPITVDSLIIQSTDIGPGITSIPINTQLVNPIKGATIPIQIPDGMVVEGFSRVGLITENWDYVFSYVKPDSGFAFIALANSLSETIPAGVTTVCNMLVHANMGSCSESLFINWDTTLSGQPSRQLTFSNVSSLPVYPGYDKYRDSSTILPFDPGDVTDDGGLDIEDIVYTVEYMFFGGPPPNRMNSMDVNGDCFGPDIADLVYMVEHQFAFGPVPQCGCLFAAKMTPYTTDQVTLYTEYRDNQTTLIVNSEIDLKGLQFELVGLSSEDPVNLLEGKFDLLHNQRGDNFVGGMLDLDGSEYLKAGNYELIVLDGEYDIVSAVIADQDLNSRIPVTEKGSIIPNSFNLYQNYPNPFNPVTKINFDLPKSASVKLTIYNIMGQEVTTLLDRQMPAGKHTFEWDASDNSSGIYLYRLETPEFSSTHKMLLLK